MKQYFIPFLLSNNMPHFVYPFLHWWYSGCSHSFASFCQEFHHVFIPNPITNKKKESPGYLGQIKTHALVHPLWSSGYLEEEYLSKMLGGSSMGNVRYTKQSLLQAKGNTSLILKLWLFLFLTCDI